MRIAGDGKASLVSPCTPLLEGVGGASDLGDIIRGEENPALSLSNLL